MADHYIGFQAPATPGAAPGGKKTRAKRTKPKNCTGGFPCGKACINRNFVCRSNLGPDGQKLTESFADFVKRTVNEDTFNKLTPELQAKIREAGLLEGVDEETAPKPIPEEQQPAPTEPEEPAIVPEVLPPEETGLAVRDQDRETIDVEAERIDDLEAEIEDIQAQLEGQPDRPALPPEDTIEDIRAEIERIGTDLEVPPRDEIEDLTDEVQVEAQTDPISRLPRDQALSRTFGENFQKELEEFGRRGQEHTRKVGEDLNALLDENITQEEYGRRADANAAEFEALAEEADRILTTIKGQYGLSQEEAETRAARPKNNVPERFKEYGQEMDPEFERQARNTLAEAYKIIGGVGNDQTLHNIYKTQEGVGAHAEGENNLLGIRDFSKLNEITHELMHHFEYSLDDDIFQEVVDWRAQTARVPDPKPMNDLFGTFLFGDDELTYEYEENRDPYAGRIYDPSPQNIAGIGEPKNLRTRESTEVLTTAVQRFVDKFEFAEFLQNDPEHVIFVLGILAKAQARNRGN